MNPSFNIHTFTTHKQYIKAQIDMCFPVNIDELTRTQIRTLLRGIVSKCKNDYRYIHKIQKYKIEHKYEPGYGMRIREVPDSRRTICKFIRFECWNNHIFDYIL